MSQQDNFDIFNLDVEDMNFQEKEDKKKILYSPKYTEGKDNVYKAIVRFIPNPEDPKNKSILHKYVYWLNEPAVNVKGYFDSPQTIGEKCPLGSTYWKLAKSESAIDQENAKKLKRKEQFHSLVYIIKDPQNPHLEGETMIFRYNKTIKALIDDEMKPDMDLGTQDPVNVFDFFKGKDFYIQITKKGEYPNYDSCKFSPKVTPITIGDEAVERTKEGMQLIKDKILENAPDLTEYDYQPMSQEQESQVYTFIQSLTNDTSHLGAIMGNEATNASAPSNNTQSKPKPKAEPVKEESKEDEFDEFDLESSSNSTKAEPAAENETEGDADDGLEDFLKGI